METRIFFHIKSFKTLGILKLAMIIFPATLSFHIFQVEGSAFPEPQSWHIPQHWNEQLQFRQLPLGSNNCHAHNIPCSGHTRDSCKRYCASVGFQFSTCKGSCCLCSHTEIDNVEPVYQSQPQRNQFHQLVSSTSLFSAIRSSVSAQKKSPAVNNSPSFHSVHNFLEHEDLETAESINNKIAAVKYSVGKHKLIEKSKTEKKGNTFKKGSSKPTWKNETFCITEGCKKAAKKLEFNMNRNANPCDNFYEYACGGFIRNTKIPEDAVEVTVFSTLHNKIILQVRDLLETRLHPQDPKPFKLAKQLYQSCMNTELLNKKGLVDLRKVLTELGGWPVLDNPALPQHYSPSLYTWSNYVAWFRQLGFSHDIFLKIAIEPDLKNNKRRVLTIGEPSLGLPREVLINDVKDKSVQAYLKYMVDTAQLFGASKSFAESEMKKVLDFEILLAQTFHRPDGQRANAYYLPTTIDDLQNKHHPSVPWLNLIKELMGGKVQIEGTEEVILSAPHYLDAFLMRVVSQTDTRTLANYAIWRLVSSSISYLGDDVKKLQFQFLAVTTGQKTRNPRWKECANIVSLSLGNAVGALYVRRHFPPTAKAEAQEVVRNIHKAFLHLLEEQDWIDQATKEKAKEKALGMGIHIGYPEQHLSDHDLTQIYKDFDFTSSDYLGNVRNLVIGANDAMSSVLKTPITRNLWVTHGKSATVNAFYHPTDNAIQFPAGILQNPFFDKERPRYMNYGAIGWVAGHEVSHGFDDQGHQFDKDGNYANWWDPLTKKTYTTKTQCIISQYGEYSPKGIGLKVNGVNSQGENIADNGGIKQAYRAYQTWVARNGAERPLPGFEDLTPNQLFWISAANNWCSVERPERLRSHLVSGVHPPAEFRVIGTFSNSLDFAKDFQCAKGTPMNPTTKCSVW